MPPDRPGSSCTSAGIAGCRCDPAQQDRLHRGLHVVVDPARAGPAKERNGPVVRVEPNLLALARIGAHEHHPAVAQADMRDLHYHRRTRHHHHLVAPVELVRLPRRKAQRHIGRRRHRRPPALPAARIAPHRIVAAAIAKAAQRLEHAHQRQPLTARPTRILREQTIQLAPPRAKLGLRLLATFVAELRRARAQDFPHHLPRHTKPTADRLDRQTLYLMPPTDLPDRLHHQHPKHDPRISESQREPLQQRGPFWTPITPPRGSFFPRRSTPRRPPGVAPVGAIHPLPRTPSGRRQVRQGRHHRHRSEAHRHPQCHARIRHRLSIRASNLITVAHKPGAVRPVGFVAGHSTRTRPPGRSKDGYPVSRLTPRTGVTLGREGQKSANSRLIACVSLSEYT